MINVLFHYLNKTSTKTRQFFFKINYAFDKDKDQTIRFINDGNQSDSIAYFTRVYMICLILPSASQLALLGYLQARAKLSALEYENKKWSK